MPPLWRYPIFSQPRYERRWCKPKDNRRAIRAINLAPGPVKSSKDVITLLLAEVSESRGARNGRSEPFEEGFEFMNARFTQAGAR